MYINISKNMTCAGLGESLLIGIHLRLFKGGLPPGLCGEVCVYTYTPAALEEAKGDHGGGIYPAGTPGGDLIAHPNFCHTYHTLLT